MCPRSRTIDKTKCTTLVFALYTDIAQQVLGLLLRSHQNQTAFLGKVLILLYTVLYVVTLVS